MDHPIIKEILAEVFALFTPWTFLLVGLIWVCLQFLLERFGEWFEKPRLGWRMFPLIPLALSIVCCFVPGPWLSPDIGTGHKVMMGVVIGVMSYFFGGVAKRLGLTGLIVDTDVVQKAVDKTRKPVPEPVPEVSGPIDVVKD